MKMQCDDRNPEKPIFFCKFKDRETGKWRPKYIPVDQRTKADAEAWFASWLAEYEASGTPKVAPAIVGTSMRDLSPWWFAYLIERNAAPEVIEESKSNMRLYIAPHAVSAISFQDIKPSQAEDYVQWLNKRISKKTKRPLSPNSIRNILKTIARFHEDARRREKIGMILNPFHSSVTKYVAPAFVRMSGNINIYFEEDQFARLMACGHIPSQRKVRYLVAVGTAAREQEQAAWLWSDWKKKGTRSFLRVSKQLKAKNSERSKAEIGPPKEEASNRDIPLHREIEKALLWWREVGYEQWTGFKPKESDPIFPGRDGKAMNWTNGSVYLQNDLKKAGVSGSYEDREELCFRFNFKVLRKTFATWLELAGVSKDRRRVLMGHQGETVLDAHYVGRNLAAFAEEVDKLPLPSFDLHGWSPSMVASPRGEKAA